MNSNKFVYYKDKIKSLDYLFANLKGNEKTIYIKKEVYSTLTKKQREKIDTLCSKHKYKIEVIENVKIKKR